MLRKCIIERDVPGIGENSPEAFCGIAQQSKDVLDGMGVCIQWLESFIGRDKTYCVYLADSEERIREHARLSGFPASWIEAIRTVLDPSMAPA